MVQYSVVCSYYTEKYNTKLFFAFIFHNPCYIRDLLLGSGKTIVAEIAILRLLQKSPGAKVVYVAPLKALARERLADWRRKLGI